MLAWKTKKNQERKIKLKPSHKRRFKRLSKMRLATMTMTRRKTASKLGYT